MNLKFVYKTNKFHHSFHLQFCPFVVLSILSRCSDLKEVSQRHVRDADQAVDDLVTSQSEIAR